MALKRTPPDWMHGHAVMLHSQQDLLVDRLQHRRLYACAAHDAAGRPGGRVTVTVPALDLRLGRGSSDEAPGLSESSLDLKRGYEAPFLVRPDRLRSPHPNVCVYI